MGHGAVRSNLTIALVAVLGCAHPAIAPEPPAACPARTFSIAGACVTDDDARTYCGKAAEPQAGGCAPRNCPAGEPLDLGTGECVPRLKLQKLAAARKQDPAFGCNKEGAALSVEGSAVACLPRATQCGRGARWSEGSCHVDVACPRGSALDTAGSCVPVFRADHGGGLLDVGSWIRVVLGPDGGEGTAAICGPLVRRPWLLGVVAHGNAILEVEVSLVFPDNDVARARVSVRAHRQYDPPTAESTGAVGVVEQLEPIWVALRSLRGVSSAASATVEVHCALAGGADALTAPHERDAGPRPDGGKPES